MPPRRVPALTTTAGVALTLTGAGVAAANSGAGFTALSTGLGPADLNGDLSAYFAADALRNAVAGGINVHDIGVAVSVIAH